MISNFKQSFDKVTEEERKAREAISTAEIEKDDIIKKEREKIKRELKEYEEEMKQFYKDEVGKLSSNEVKQEETTRKMNREMVFLKQEAEANKSKVIDFLLESALDVDLSIPEVIKGQFSIRMGPTK